MVDCAVGEVHSELKYVKTWQDTNGMSSNLEIFLDRPDSVRVAIDGLFHDCIEICLEVIHKTSGG